MHSPTARCSRCRVRASEAALVQASTRQAAAMRFLDVADLTIAGVPCVVSRSGYTGEDGYEIGMASADASSRRRSPACAARGCPRRARRARQPAAGGGAVPVRRGPRRDDHPGRSGAGMVDPARPPQRRLPRRGRDPRPARRPAPRRRRVGLLPEGRAPVRGGTLLFAAEAGCRVRSGEVSSGCFGPTIGTRPIAMGYVRTDLATPGTRLFAELRGRRVALAVAAAAVRRHLLQAGRQPAMIYYTADHDWLKLDGDIATVGITAHAARSAGRSGVRRIARGRRRARQGRRRRDGRIGEGRVRNLCACRRGDRRGERCAGERGPNWSTARRRRAAGCSSCA